MKHKTLTRLNACSDAVEFCSNYPDLETAWQECQNGDWMLWYAGKRGVDRKTIVAACECARLALPHAKDPRVLACIETTEKWTRGEATINDVHKARAAAYAAYAAAVADARLKVRSQCADIVRKYLPTLP